MITQQEKQNRRERIGLAIEEFVCQHTSVQELSKKYKIGNNLMASSIEAYLGTPGERVMISFSLVDSDTDVPNPELELIQNQLLSQTQPQSQTLTQSQTQLA
jgi:hypothetical protein